MALSIEVLLSPAEIMARREQDFADAVCVVFDILRATSVMITGLANGAAGFIPVGEISEALAWHRQHPEALLAGERNGLRIGAELTGGVEFHLGNSPHEYTPDRVAGKIIITTTTNGTRALRACSSASHVFAASLLNLSAMADWVSQNRPGRLILVSAGTGEAPALEDVLAAGALIACLREALPDCVLRDSAEIAHRVYRDAGDDLPVSVNEACNARRLRAHAELRADVAFCLQRDALPLLARLDRDGVVRKIS